MVKILFYRAGLVVRALELYGLINSFLIFKKFPLQPLFLFLFCSYLFIRLCDLLPWYPKKETPAGLSPKMVGIRVHFQKTLVPTSYILAIATASLLWAPDLFAQILLGIADLCMMVVVPVNGILIWFHFHDPERKSVNYFSLNKYLTHPPTPSLTLREGAEKISQ